MLKNDYNFNHVVMYTPTGSSRLNKGTLEFDPTLLPYLTLARTDTSKYLSLLTGTADTVFTQGVINYNSKSEPDPEFALNGVSSLEVSFLTKAFTCTARSNLSNLEFSLSNASIAIPSLDIRGK